MVDKKKFVNEINKYCEDNDLFFNEFEKNMTNSQLLSARMKHMEQIKKLALKKQPKNKN